MSDAHAGAQSRARDALPAHACAAPSSFASRGANAVEVGPRCLWNAHEYVRGVPRRLLGSDVHAERPRLLLSAPSAAGIPKVAKGREQQQQRGEQQMQKRKRGRPAHTAANRRARLVPRMDLSSARKTVLCAMFRLCLVTTPWMFTIVCSHTVCDTVCGGAWGHMRHKLIYILEHTRLCLWSQPLCLFHGHALPGSSATTAPI